MPITAHGERSQCAAGYSQPRLLADCPSVCGNLGDRYIRFSGCNFCARARICPSDQRERGSARALSLVGCGPPALGQTACEATWQCCFALAPLAVTLSVSVVTLGRLAQPVPPSSVQLVAANHVSRTFVAAGHALGLTLACAPVRRTSLSVAVSSSSWHVRTRSVRGPCGSDCRWATHRFRKTCRRTWMSVVQGTRPR